MIELVTSTWEKSTKMFVDDSKLMDFGMNCDHFTLWPICHVSVILITANVVGYVAVKHVELCNDTLVAQHIDIIGTYIAFGISFVLVTIPTITAPGVHPRNQMSAFLTFLWAMIYMTSLYNGVYDSLPIQNEIEWIRWVVISFLCLLPHTMGLIQLSSKTSNPPIFGGFVAAVGLLMMFMSSLRTWKNTYSLLTESEGKNFVFIDSLWGNCIFWLGIFLVNSIRRTDPSDRVAIWTGRGTHRQVTLLRLFLIVSFVCGPGLLFFTHPCIQIFLDENFQVFRIATLCPLRNKFSVPPIDPTLVRILGKHRNSDVSCTAGNTQELIADSFHEQLSKSDDSSTQIQFTTEPPNFSHLPELPIGDRSSFYDEMDDDFNCIPVPDIPKTSPVFHQPEAVFTRNTFVPKVGIQQEVPFVIRFEKPTHLFKMFFSMFKLKISTELLSGQWN